MKEWIEVVQRMIDWIEEHVEQNKMLTSLSDEIGYSPWYCSVLFHDVTGMTIKSYASVRVPPVFMGKTGGRGVLLVKRNIMWYNIRKHTVVRVLTSRTLSQSANCVSGIIRGI